MFKIFLRIYFLASFWGFPWKIAAGDYLKLWTNLKFFLLFFEIFLQDFSFLLKVFFKIWMIALAEYKFRREKLLGKRTEFWGWESWLTAIFRFSRLELILTILQFLILRFFSFAQFLTFLIFQNSQLIRFWCFISFSAKKISFQNFD